VLTISAAPAYANHVQCGDVITQDTTLDSDLNCTRTGFKGLTALTVRGSDLTLDLGGHTVRGDTGTIQSYWTGIQVEGSRIAVKDGQVEDFITGVQIGGTSAGSNDETFLRQLRIANSDLGVFAFAGSHSRIEHNRFVNSGALGIGLAGVTDSRIEGNSIRGGQVGMLLEDYSDRNLITRNSITGSASDGILLHASLQHSGTTGNVIERNVVSGNRGNGVLLETFYYRGTPLDQQTDTVLRNNVIRGNALDGVAVQDGSTGTLVEGNSVLRNGDDGLDVKDASSSIFGNRAWFNGDLGIEAVAGVTGSGNSAKHNGNPAQCVPSYLCKTTGKPKS
jgi:nitrous oxidase accessory protein NosD